ncbi:hypothetical protein A2U01_0118081 [Trifolium medium]|uniref:Uncharacterized protein n=1 Tax=Trifolium medium TaxID=97028 RepID=A0A392WCF0_9FABA|nr:hypothetical protein [Trifolium medium]
MGALIISLEGSENPRRHCHVEGSDEGYCRAGALGCYVRGFPDLGSRIGLVWP